jgi:ribosome production factor 1
MERRKRALAHETAKKDKKREASARRRKNREDGVETTTKKQRTLESTREADATFVVAEDEEVFGDEADDEFAGYYQAIANSTSNEEGDGLRTPKIMITTRPRPSRELFRFIGGLMAMVPNAFYYPRRNYDVKQICTFATNKKFTHLFVLAEKSKVCNGMVISHLPAGPTAFFKISNVLVTEDIPNHGQKTSHVPEIILNRFATRLGRRVGRFLGSVFPHRPEFKGRQVVTFHNQRDFIFIRHHRYVFEHTAGSDDEGDDAPPAASTASARLQELGPRFTMKLRWLQDGTFDTATGEYEWFHRRKEMDTSRRVFHM